MILQPLESWPAMSKPTASLSRRQVMLGMIGTAGDGRIYLDPAAGRRADGLIEAAVIDYSTSLARFGGGGD